MFQDQVAMGEETADSSEARTYKGNDENQKGSEQATVFSAQCQRRSNVYGHATNFSRRLGRRCHPCIAELEENP